MHETAAAISFLLCCALSVVAWWPSSAAAGPCDKPILRAEGRLSGWTHAPAYNEMVARRLAVRRWESTAAEPHGSRYVRWADAKGRRVACEMDRDHPWLRGRVACVAAAIPCAGNPT
jgi:hypothetical protein